MSILQQSVAPVHSEPEPDLEPTDADRAWWAAQDADEPWIAEQERSGRAFPDDPYQFDRVPPAVAVSFPDRLRLYAERVAPLAVDEFDRWLVAHLRELAEFARGVAARDGAALDRARDAELFERGYEAALVRD